MRLAPLLTVLIATGLAPAVAAAEPMLFLRVDPAGGLEQGDVGAAYSIEAARGLLAIEGSTERGDAYRGATHRLTLAYGITGWLAAGLEMSAKQPATDELRVGMLSPELRLRLDRIGLRVPGLGTYAQGRLRITAQRASSLVGGLIYEHESGSFRFSARAGFEATVGGDAQEVGYRAEIGAGWLLGSAWRLTAEAWGNTRWVADISASDFHAGPGLQYRWDVLRIGTQLGLGLKLRTNQTVLDGVLALRVAVAF